MAIPATPSNVIVQQGNGEVLVSWDIVAGATSYPVLRSTDGVTYASLGSAATNSYLDTTVVLNTLYYYQVRSTNGSGTSSASSGLQIIPTTASDMSLGALRLAAQQRADRVNSNFVGTAEWNSYINQSYFELYDLLVDAYEDYFMTSTQFTTNGTDNYFTLPTDFYKLLGVDLGLQSSNGRVTLKKYDFIERNRYVFPNLNANFLGVFNLRYRLMGNRLTFIPTPSAAQNVTVWYIPKLSVLLQDTDVANGISGWTEYVIVDAAIKALQKEESNEAVQVLFIQKQALIKRIEEAAMNRDAGQGDTISPTRGNGGFGSYGGPGFDGGFGGY